MTVKRCSITFAASALDDLKEILAYYAEQDVPAVGQQIVEELLSRIQDLANHPDMGRIVPEFEVKNLRELIHPPFRIVYRRDKSRVRVVRVWRSERFLKLP